MAHLPTYEDAVNGPRPLDLFSRYLDDHSLATCCRVSKEWCASLRSVLWEDPVAVLAKKPQPYTRILRFMNQSQEVPPYLRRLVTTLDYRVLLKSAALAANRIDYQTHEYNLTIQWACNKAVSFPNLLYLIMDGMKQEENMLYYASPSVPKRSRSGLTSTIIQSNNETKGACSQAASSSTSDHTPKPEHGNIASLESWLGPAQPWVLSAVGCYSFDGLRQVTNLTAAVSQLLYIDISYTLATDNRRENLAQLFHLPNIQVLKLRGLRLTDSELLPLAEVLPGNRPWCLDLRDNLLTNASLDTIIPMNRLETSHDMSIEGRSGIMEEYYDDSPIYQRRDGETEISEKFYRGSRRPNEIETFLEHLDQVKHMTVNGWRLDEGKFLKRAHLTHLYIAENRFTSSGVCQLLKRLKSLQVFDVGAVQEERYPNDRSAVQKWGKIYSQPDTAEYLQRKHGSRLEELRIHHSIITGIPTIAPTSASLFDRSPTRYDRHMPLTQVYLDSSGEPSHSSQDNETLALPLFTPTDNNRLRELVLTSIPTHVPIGHPLPTILENFLRCCNYQEKSIKESNLHPGATSRLAPTVLSGLRAMRLEFIPPVPENIRQSSWTEPGGRGNNSTELSEDLTDLDNLMDTLENPFSFFQGENSWTPTVESPGASKQSSLSLMDSSSLVPTEPPAYDEMSPGTNRIKRPASLVLGNCIDVIERLKLFRKQEEAEQRKWRGKLSIEIRHT